MREVATLRGAAPLGAIERAALDCARRLVLRDGDDSAALDDLAPLTAGELEALRGGPAALRTTRCLAVMSLRDGILDAERAAIAAELAAALDAPAAELERHTQAAQAHLEWFAMDRMRSHINSIQGLRWHRADVMGSFLPYTGAGADLDLAKRFRGLRSLAEGTLGRALWDHCRSNRYPPAGERDSLGATFTLPHDTAHIVSGYDTSTMGELLVAAFGAAMRRTEPIVLDLLPLLVASRIAESSGAPATAATAGDADIARLEVALQRGAAATIDLFAPGCDFWSHADETVADFRTRHHVAPIERSASADAP